MKKWGRIAALAFSLSVSAEAASVVVVNGDDPGVGFNDPTPVAPVGGNTATTLGAQRLAVVQWAADRVGQLLYSPVPIAMRVYHDDDLYCAANAATLAAAGPSWLLRTSRRVADHPDADTWYPSALLHRLIGTQLFAEDLRVIVNPNLGEADCLSGFDWYLGLDGDAPPGTLSFVETVLHEITHGVGFTALTNEQGLVSSQYPSSISPYYSYAYDGAVGKFWWQMSAQERATSATGGTLAWAGPRTTQAVLELTTPPIDGAGNLLMYAPMVFSSGSSLSHFKAGTNPSLLMEPFASSDLDVFANDIDVALEFLHDLGWRNAGCGNGIVEGSEQCDLGAANDVNANAPDECTTQCTWFVSDLCPADPNKTVPGICGCGASDADTDGDGIANCLDGCPTDPNKTSAGVCGCGVPDTDADGDGTSGCLDACSADPDKTEPGLCGCGVPDTDTDGDGTPDCLDTCPTDANKTAPGACGCGHSDLDSDADGIANCLDSCPNDPNKIEPGLCGCGVADTDSDGDGTPDCSDTCPNDAQKVNPGHCGCGALESDADADGTPDCLDACPTDPAKTSPGSCGCGVPEIDGDGDGTPDCADGCPLDPTKTSPGLCGCGTSDRDGDGDGVPDCSDACPLHTGKTHPGICGCAAPDVDTDGDGVVDCNDQCPNDANKLDPGLCGCGQSDRDQDGDGIPDCSDLCPTRAGDVAERGCPVELLTDSDAGSEPTAVSYGDAGATLDGLPLLPDGGLDHAAIEAELRDRLNLSGDAGLKVALDLGLPDACQCRLERRSSGYGGALALLLGVLFWARRRHFRGTAA